LDADIPYGEEELLTIFKPKEPLYKMNYGSVCSGVEAATLAWAPLGWKAVFFAEVEPFPAAVLQQRFGATRPKRLLPPAEAETEKERKQRESWEKQIAELPEGGTIPNLGDFPKITKEDYDEPIDLLVGGTPCQSYSIAGLRRGLADPRGNLALEFVRLAYRSGVRWTVWENVPGVLSSGGGKDFASFLSLLCGWEIDVPEGGWRKSGVIVPAPGCFGLAWRILDAQYTRVPEFPRAIPQRRRRLFVIGYIGSWIYPATVLFDGEMRGGDTPPRRTKRKTFATGSEGSIDTTKSIRLRGGREGGGKGALVGTDISHTLATGNDQTIITLSEDAQWWDGSDQAGTLTGTSNNQLMPDKGRLQCVIEPAVKNKAVGIGRDAFNQGRNAKYGMSLAEDVQPTLTAKGPGAVCFENNPTDARLKEVPVSPTVMSRWGTGGNQTPLVMDDVPPMDTTVGFIKNDAGGEQQGFWGDTFPTLRSGALPAVAYNVTFCDANGTRKDRPNGGLYVTEANTGKTVTANGPNTEMVIVDPAECVPLDLRNATRDPNKKDEQNRQGVGVGEDGAPMNTITSASVPGVGWQSTVRKLLPVECERLMGFPDNHTRISWKGKPEEECPDAPRYKACGNSMCVNVMAWIGHRIQAVEESLASRDAKPPAEAAVTCHENAAEQVP